MFEVEITNFQSIQHTELVIDGFTSLDGRSNIGKSAIVRAIRSALTGASGTDFVRHRADCERITRGRKECKCQSTVRIRTPVMTLVWEKGDSVNRYTVTKPGEKPQIYDSVFRGTPDFLLPEFQKIKIGDSTQLLQVSEQFDPIFLLNQSGPVVADVLSDVAHLEDVNTAIRLVNKDRKETAATRKVREYDLKELLKALEGYSELDPALTRVRQVEEHYRLLESDRQTLCELERFISEALCLRSEVETLQGVEQIRFPSTVELKAASEKSLQVQDFYNRAAEKVPQVKGLSNVQNIAIPEESGVQSWVAKLKVLEQFTASSEKLNSAVSTLSEADNLAIPAIGLVQDSLKKLDDLSQWQLKIRGLLWVLDASASLATLPKLDVESLQGSLQIRKLLERSVSVETDVLKLEEDLCGVEKDLAQVLHDFEELGLCPTCTQPVHAERCISRAS